MEPGYRIKIGDKSNKLHFPEQPSTSTARKHGLERNCRWEFSAVDVTRMNLAEQAALLTGFRSQAFETGPISTCSCQKSCESCRPILCRRRSPLASLQSIQLDFANFAFG